MTTTTELLKRHFPNYTQPPGKDELSLEITPRVSQLHSLAKLVEDFGENNSVPEQQIFMLNLILDELMTNYVRHSMHKVSMSRMELALRAEPDQVVLTILDTGPPFNPLDVPPPDMRKGIDDRQLGGMGLHLVRSYCDRMRHEAIHGYNKLTIEIDFKPAPSGGSDAPEEQP